MTARKNLRIFMEVLIFLIIAYVLLSCLTCAHRSYYQWDTLNDESAYVVDNIQYFSWITLVCAVAQILFLLCNRNVLQMYAAIGACLQAFVMPLKIHLNNLLNDVIVYVHAGFPPRDTSKWTVTPIGYMVSAFALVVVICSIAYMIQCRKKKAPDEENQQYEEREEVAV